MSKEKILNNQDEILQFLVKETIFINPISKIIDNLENNIYFNKDIKFLENELKKFMSLTIDILNINFNLKLSKITIERDLEDYQLNDSAKQKYLYYFRGLLEFFKNQL